MDNPWTNTFGLLWVQFGVTLCHFGSLWGRSGMSFGSLGNNFGVSFGSLWNHFGVTLGSIPGQFGVNPGIQEPSAR